MITTKIVSLCERQYRKRARQVELPRPHREISDRDAWKATTPIRPAFVANLVRLQRCRASAAFHQAVWSAITAAAAVGRALVRIPAVISSRNLAAAQLIRDRRLRPEPQLARNEELLHRATP